MKLRHHASVLRAALSLVALSACREGSDGGVPVDGLLVVGEDPVIVVHDLPYRPQVQIGGRVVYLPESRCLVIEKDSGGTPSQAIPLWPKGAVPLVWEGKRGVELPGFGRIVEGDTVRAAGGGWRVNDERARGLKIPPSCRKYGFVQLNPGSFR